MNFQAVIDGLTGSQKSTRDKYIDELCKLLSIHEAGAIAARISEKSCKNPAKRFGLYPPSDWNLVLRTKKLEASFWTADEIDFTQDRNDFNELTKEEKKPLLRAFGYFAIADGAIANMLAFQMILVAGTVEKQQFYVVQLDNERVHQETYGKMIYTLVSDPEERNAVFNSVNKIQSIKELNSFIEKSFMHPDGERQLYVNLAAAEYITLQPMFCYILWYRAYKRDKMPRVIFANEQIMKDEASHGLNGCENYNDLPSNQKYTDGEIHKLIDHVVKLVDKFIDELHEDISLEDLTPDRVKQYVRFVADDMLERLHHSKYYKAENPFEWMNFTSLIPKTNFYEGTVGQYSRYSVSQSIEKMKALVEGVSTETIDPYSDDIKF